MNNFRINTTVIYSAYVNYLKTSDNCILPLTNGKFGSLINDLNKLVKVGSAINVNVFTNATGSEIKYSNKPVLNINYTYSHQKKVNDTIVEVDGSVTILFTDGTMFTTADNNTIKYWFSIIGITPVVITPLL